MAAGPGFKQLEKGLDDLQPESSNIDEIQSLAEHWGRDYVDYVIAQAPTTEYGWTGRWKGDWKTILRNSERLARLAEVGGSSAFVDGRAEEWMVRWAARLSGEGAEAGVASRAMLTLLARVERATGSGRSIPLFADIVRGVATPEMPWSTHPPDRSADFGSVAAPWPRFWAVLTVCSLPPHPTIVAALVDILDDDTAPQSESTVKSSPAAIKNYAAMALLYLRDRVGLEAFVQAWESTVQPGYPGLGWGNWDPKNLYWIGLDNEIAPFKRALGGIGDAWLELARQTGTDPIKEHVDQLEQDPCSVDDRIVSALASTGDSRLVEPMLRWVAQCRPSSTGFSYLKTLIQKQVEQGNTIGLQTLIGALSNPDDKVRAAVTNLLGELGYSEAEAAVRGLLDDPSRKVRRAAKGAARRFERSAR